MNFESAAGALRLYPVNAVSGILPLSTGGSIVSSAETMSDRTEKIIILVRIVNGE